MPIYEIADEGSSVKGGANKTATPSFTFIGLPKIDALPTLPRLGHTRIVFDPKGDPLLPVWQELKRDPRVYRRDLSPSAAEKRISDARTMGLISLGAAKRKAKRLRRHGSSVR